MLTKVFNTRTIKVSKSARNNTAMAKPVSYPFDPTNLELHPFACPSTIRASPLIRQHLIDGTIVMWTRGLSDEKQETTRQAQEWLDKNNIAYDQICLSSISRNLADAFTNALAMDTGCEDFPKIYFGDCHLGGLDDLKDYVEYQKSSEKLMHIISNGIGTESSTDSNESSDDGEFEEGMD